MGFKVPCDPNDSVISIMQWAVHLAQMFCDLEVTLTLFLDVKSLAESKSHLPLVATVHVVC